MSATNDAFNGIRSYIATGRFQPGSKLPTEEKLCEMLNMSRSPVREALRMLDVLNVVEIRHGSGVYVKSLCADELIGSLSLTIGLMPLKSLLDIYDMRVTVESSIAAKAAAKISDDNIATLTLLQNQIEQCQTPADSTDFDDQFHQLIADVADRPASKAFLNVMRSRSSAFSLFFFAHGESVFETSNKGHRAIISAFRRHDPMLAEAAMASHVESTRIWLETLQPKVFSDLRRQEPLT